MKAIFILSFLLATTFVFGQELKTTEKRVEIDLKDGRYNEQVFTMGKYGVVLKSFSKDEGFKTNMYLHHDVYNTDLELYETEPLAYDPYLPIMSTYETEDHIFHLAYKRKKRPIRIYEFDVKDMPVTVAVNSEGISMHNEGPREWQAKIAGIPVKTV